MDNNDLSCLGKHLILDVWTCSTDELCSIEIIKPILEEAAIASGATIVNSMFHSFGENVGITGLLLLSESHISVHTWPEKSFAAFDIFTCGNCDNGAAADTILELLPGIYHSRINRLVRGSFPISLNSVDILHNF